MKASVWSVHDEAVLVRTVRNEPTREKIAGLDMDGTLLVWRCSGWPSRLDDYELWNTAVISKLRDLYDHQNYKLVIVSNQGGIRKALQGKRAQKARLLVDWIASKVDRPLHAVLSANKTSGYHKPSAKLWTVLEDECNQGVKADLAQSFYCGDSTGEDDPQGGVDSQLAENVSVMRDAVLQFYHPKEYFGPSNQTKRLMQKNMQAYDAPPKQTLQHTLPGLYSSYGLHSGIQQKKSRKHIKARTKSDEDGSDTVNGSGPILLMLCGAQGSGKSTFCNRLLQGDNEAANNNKDNGNKSRNVGDDTNTNDDRGVLYLCQDTIQNGKPGRIEKVVTAARSALQDAGRSVLIDRTHLEASQRSLFVSLAQELDIPVHIVVLHPSQSTVAKRVRERTNHPGKVEGSKGASLAAASWKRLQQPTYQEGFASIRACLSQEDANHVCQVYKRYFRSGNTEPMTVSSIVRLHNEDSGTLCMPALMLGTMSIGKRTVETVVQEALSLGWQGIDTAPTYKNETEIGTSLGTDDKGTKDVFVTIKVPKRATTAEQVRDEFEASLAKLSLDKADLLLLHWPCVSDVQLQTVWNGMETLVGDGRVRAIGVCNFSVDALRQLLPICSVRPAVNQIERHPLLPQWELVNFCWNNGIVVQSHTPLGHGSLLDHETLGSVAEETGLSVAQVCLRWNLQHNVPVVTKATSREHLQQGIDALKSESSLSADHMKTIDGIQETKRFVTPPFMYGRNLLYAWGERMPPATKKDGEKTQ